MINNVLGYACCNVVNYMPAAVRLEPMADLINLLMRKRDAEASAGHAFSPC